MASGIFKEHYYIRLFNVFLFIALACIGTAFSIYVLTQAATSYMYILGIFLLILSIISGFFNVFAAMLYYRSYFYDKHMEKLKQSLKPLTKFPTVAIAMPVYNENPRIVERNFLRLMELNYPKNKLKFYFLDDSTKPELQKEFSSFSKRHGIIYLHRNERRGFKAGNLNNMLKYVKQEFIAIFDYDEYLVNKNFLMDAMPFFQDGTVGYVQTEKNNFGGSFFADCVNLFDSFFFKFIQPARAIDNTAIFAGSCGVIRKKALDKTGGFPEYVIEDTFFSFESDVHGYKGLYLPKIYAYGRPVTSFSGLMKQQWRYNYGDTQFLLYFLNKEPRKLTRRSLLWNIDYITHGFGLNYLSVMILLFTMASIMIVFSNLQFIHLSIFQILRAGGATLYLESLGSVAFALSFIVPILLTKIYFKSIRKGIMVFLLNFSLSIVRTKAAISALLSKAPSWQWNRIVDKNTGNLTHALYGARYEIALSSVLFGLGLLAYQSSNYTGSVWLSIYGGLYLCAAIMIYKYG